MLTRREQQLNACPEDFNLYADKVIYRARLLLGDNRPVCLDSLNRSWVRKEDIDEAARRVADDTLYWDGEW